MEKKRKNEEKKKEKNKVSGKRLLINKEPAKNDQLILTQCHQFKINLGYIPNSV